MVVEFDYGIWSDMKEWYLQTGGSDWQENKEIRTKHKNAFISLRRRLQETMPHCPVVPRSFRKKRREWYRDLLEGEANGSSDVELQKDTNFSSQRENTRTVVPGSKPDALCLFPGMEGK